MRKSFLSVCIYFLFVLIVSLNSAYAKASGNSVIQLATTSSTENSGLLNYLLPTFTHDTGYNVHTIVVGTGKALRMGRDGDVDVLLVHAKKAEQKFMAGGNGDKRSAVMYNDFVIVGPNNDPAKVAEVKRVTEAMALIASSQAPFVSRGDDSGTHKKELDLWKAANIKVKDQAGKWYREAGQGMGKVLQIAGEMNAYTITDRGTWLAYKSKSPLKIVFEGDTSLFNPYAIIAVSSKKYPDLNSIGAHALMDWITSERGQHLIGQYKIAGKVLFTPNASTLAQAPVTTH